jgi:hypothetical protein
LTSVSLIEIKFLVATLVLTEQGHVRVGKFAKALELSGAVIIVPEIVVPAPPFLGDRSRPTGWRSADPMSPLRQRTPRHYIHQVRAVSQVNITN